MTQARIVFETIAVYRLELSMHTERCIHARVDWVMHCWRLASAGSLAGLSRPRFRLLEHRARAPNGMNSISDFN